MTEFVSYDSRVQVRREVVEAFIHGVPSGTSNLAGKILSDHGIDGSGSEDWFPLPAYLSAMSDIGERFGPTLLHMIGAKIAFNAVLPENMGSLGQFLPMLDETYQMNHRGGVIGSYRFSNGMQLGDYTGGSLVCYNPYPCAFDRGVIEGFARRMTDEKADVLVRHDDDKPCRAKGGSSCTYVIHWNEGH